MAPSRSRPRFLCGARLLAPVLLLGVTVPAAAQCSGQWLPGDSVPGVGDTIRAMVMGAPDGPGPKPPLLVVGGVFTFAGNTACNHIAAWDPATSKWSALGSGLNDDV